MGLTLPIQLVSFLCTVQGRAILRLIQIWYRQQIKIGRSAMTSSSSGGPWGAIPDKACA